MKGEQYFNCQIKKDSALSESKGTQEQRMFDISVCISTSGLLCIGYAKQICCDDSLKLEQSEPCSASY